MWLNGGKACKMVKCGEVGFDEWLIVLNCRMNRLFYLFHFGLTVRSLGFFKRTLARELWRENDDTNTTKQKETGCWFGSEGSRGVYLSLEEDDPSHFGFFLRKWRERTRIKSSVYNGKRSFKTTTNESKKLAHRANHAPHLHAPLLHLLSRSKLWPKI